MKKIISIFLLIAMANILGAQTSSLDEKRTISTLKTFYTAYMSTFSDSGNVRQSERRLEILRSKYCTAKCRKQYKKLVEETDGDPIIQGQDSAPEFAKTLSIKRNIKESSVYTVSYYYFPLGEDGKQHKETITIKLLMIKENGNVKIDAFL
ncbi:MAG TPA: DUF3828 domain-containing protein [Mucilaginibacter sp.]|jgi:hypothetical protein|nr:DUF3828 domain-containing protein [Mucilaginibacter sp.]